MAVTQFTAVGEVKIKILFSFDKVLSNPLYTCSNEETIAQYFIQILKQECLLSVIGILIYLASSNINHTILCYPSQEVVILSVVLSHFIRSTLLFTCTLTNRHLY